MMKAEQIHKKCSASQSITTWLWWSWSDVWWSRNNLWLSPYMFLVLFFFFFLIMRIQLFACLHCGTKWEEQTSHKIWYQRSDINHVSDMVATCAENIYYTQLVKQVLQMDIMRINDVKYAILYIQSTYKMQLQIFVLSNFSLWKKIKKVTNHGFSWEMAFNRICQKRQKGYVSSVSVRNSILSLNDLK